MEVTTKYLNGECFMDIIGIELLKYLKKYNNNFFESHRSISKATLFEIIEVLEKLFEEGELKKIDYGLLTYAMDYKFIHSVQSSKESFDKFLFKQMKINGKKWMEG